MSRSIEFAMGLAGVPSGPYGAAGYAVRESLKSDDDIRASRPARDFIAKAVGKKAPVLVELGNFPRDFEPYKGQVGELKSGQVIWVAPFSIRHDEQGNLWISPSDFGLDQEAGTAQLPLMKLLDGLYIDDDQAKVNKDEFGDIPGDSKNYIPVEVLNEEAARRVFEEVTGQMKDSDMGRLVKAFLDLFN
jgi:hypothetical protein